ncbi:hypothetical protein M9Y10_021373 [Tritrichomonas musculus]|uniref:Protein kinase domain-containing protein n=1 Tax=Tritrichomonas musculus TaxID=1915356 RepID=A0ABR2HEP3_9EUKA
MIHHPLIPKFYGIGKKNKEELLLVEYIKGSSLDKISEMKLNKEEKMSIIYELLIVIEYLHLNGFIYRDLKPDNFIIDESKTLVLIDFDRMLTKDDEQITKNFCSMYIAPEIFESERYSYEVDIYSIGLIIYFIIMEKEAPKELYERNIFDDFNDEFSELGKLCEKCINIEGSNRPTIDEIIINFLKYYSSSIQNLTILNNIRQMTIQKNNLLVESDQNNSETLEEENSIQFDLNDPENQFELGLIYHNGEGVERDIVKAILFYSLAADQNHIEAQFNLGAIFHKGEGVERDFDEAIHYYTLAANQNYPQAQYYLGLIYYEGEYIKQDFNKAFYYFQLAANQNHPQAQFYLGLFYHKGTSVQQDISKAIHYYTIAADKNIIEAQLNLGLIYSKGMYSLCLAKECFIIKALILKRISKLQFVIFRFLQKMAVLDLTLFSVSFIHKGFMLKEILKKQFIIITMVPTVVMNTQKTILESFISTMNTKRILLNISKKPFMKKMTWFQCTIWHTCIFMEKKFKLILTNRLSY